MKRKLIVTAHDFGLCSSVNEGIIYALNQPNNIITELSLLTNAPGSEEAAVFLQEVKTSVNLCLNLTTFSPLSPDTPSLVDEKGNFLRVDVSAWDFSSINRFHEDDVAKEVDAQWDWFVEKAGRKPSAILTRKNEFGDPKILVPVVAKAKKEGVAVRTPVWMWRENFSAQSYVEEEGVRHSRHIFVGLRDWRGRYGYDLSEDLPQLIEEIESRQGISELLVFTGFVDEELFSLSSINWQRGQFLPLLKNSDLSQSIKENFDLISFADL